MHIAIGEVQGHRLIASVVANAGLAVQLVQRLQGAWLIDPCSVNFHLLLLNRLHCRDDIVTRNYSTKAKKSGNISTLFPSLIPFTQRPPYPTEVE
jgi:hypothetical protein